MTTCSKLRSEYEVCESDYECQNHQFCWYPNKEHSIANRKACMPLYSQSFGVKFGWKASDNNNPTEKDFMSNGKYCESGLAYPISDNEAKCTVFKEMKFNDTVVDAPYLCNPVD